MFFGSLSSDFLMSMLTEFEVFIKKSSVHDKNFRNFKGTENNAAQVIDSALDPGLQAYNVR